MLREDGTSKSGNSAKSSVLDNISQLASAAAIFLTAFTYEIYQTPLPLFVFKWQQKCSSGNVHRLKLNKILYKIFPVFIFILTY